MAELFSPPRLTSACERYGCTGAANWDLKLCTDHDLTKSENQAKVMKELRELSPDVLSITVPCDQFSSLQNMNSVLASVRKRRRKWRDAVKLLQFGLDCANYQVHVLKGQVL